MDNTQEKQKIHLTQEKETLLIPLLSKAMETRRRNPIIMDTKAEEILQGITYDFSGLHVPRQTLIMLAMRAKKLDSVVQEYLVTNDNPLVLHLGCGLDSRIHRVPPDRGKWYDLDFQEVITLRKTFYEETDSYRMIPSSVTDLTWLDQIAGNGPACIIAEGLLMYLHEEEVKRLFVQLQERFPGSEIAFDAYSRYTARRANQHPSIKRTGAHTHWGIDDVTEMASWGKGFTLLEEWSFCDSCGISTLGLRERVLFRLVGLFPAARKAHRILRMRM